ncbi:MAG: HypC/HybG/HupF family hydrogenase formation chaperone [Rhodocyclaceae bacterium]
MCLAIPSLVLSIDGATALVDTLGDRREVSLLLMDEAPAAGDYVLIRQGSFAYERVEPERARESLALMDEVLSGGSPDVRTW